ANDAYCHTRRNLADCWLSNPFLQFLSQHPRPAPALTQAVARPSGRAQTAMSKHSQARSPEMIKHHYLIEKELAARLRTANKEERRHLYTEVYDELFRRVPDHPQLSVKPEQRAQEVSERLALLQTYLQPTSTYL